VFTVPAALVGERLPMMNKVTALGSVENDYRGRSTPAGCKARLLPLGSPTMRDEVSKVYLDAVDELLFPIGFVRPRRSQSGASVPT
jgi:hypothetical protein